MISHLSQDAPARQAPPARGPPQSTTIGVVPASAVAVPGASNAVSLVGRLTAPFELRTFPATGNCVAKASLAFSVGADKTEFVNIEAWGALGAAAAAELGKGDRVQVTGRLRVAEFTTRAGAKRKDASVAAGTLSRVVDAVAPGGGGGGGEWADQGQASPDDAAAGWGGAAVPPPPPGGVWAADGVAAAVAGWPLAPPGGEGGAPPPPEWGASLASPAGPDDWAVAAAAPAPGGDAAAAAAWGQPGPVAAPAPAPAGQGAPCPWDGEDPASWGAPSALPPPAHGYAPPAAAAAYAPPAPAQQAYTPRRGGGDPAKAAAAAALWESLFGDPGQWWDNRISKRSPRAPDFKHKANGDAALWIDSSSTPAWVGGRLGELPPPPAPR